MALPDHPDNIDPLPAEPGKTSAIPTTSWRRRRVRWWMVLAGLSVLAAGGWFGGRQLWADYHLRAAEKALERYEFSEALDEFERCLRVWPNSLSTRLQAARAARRDGRFEKAEEHLAACEKLGVTPTPATSLERILLRAQMGDLLELEKSLNDLIRENHPDATLIMEALARGYIQTARQGNALTLLGMLLEREPNHPEAHFLRATLVEEQQQIDALPDYRLACQLAPHRLVYRLRLAEALVQYSQATEAWTHFAELLRDSPKDPDVLFGAARCLRALGRDKAALEHLDTLLQDHPDHAEGWAERGRIFSDRRDGAEAIRCLRRAFELAPTSHVIGDALYTELYGQKLVKEANIVREKVERLQGDARRLLELNQRLRVQQRNAPIRYEIGMIYLRNKVDSEALRWFFAALRDDPAHCPTHHVLADYYQRTGKAEEAAYHREHAGKAAP